MITQWSSRSLLQRMGLAISALLVLPLALLPLLTADLTRSLLEMGGSQSSILARLALSRWFGPSAGALATVALSLALREKAPSRRRLWTVVTIVVVGLAAVIISGGLLSPLADLRTMTAPLQ
jgi:hypothetical protein